MTSRVALYARVSSDQQSQASTIDSQVTAIQERIKADGYILLKEFQFLDDGYSGSTLMRPGLERLRDAVANRLLDSIYVYSPDRLARKYAYQYLLMEEFGRFDIKIIFLNNQLGHNPESDLLLQVQGMIAEYERMKIMERSRRGKLHAAKQGSPSVLSCAPYGYRYTAKQSNNGIVGYEIIEEEAKIIRSLFSWIGCERMSINAATNRLTNMGIRTPTGENTKWNRGSVHHILRNPAYKGTAAFGKNKSVSRKPRLRAYKGQSIQPKTPYSSERVTKDKWILIPVPAIIDVSLFEIVQEQLEENKRLKRARARGARYLLQGLVVCSLCEYGYCGNTATGTRKHDYYSCGGTRVYSNRDRKCDNSSVHANMLEMLIWKEVKDLLNNPFYLEKEYERRIKEIEKTSDGEVRNKLTLEKQKLEKNITRLIDSYTEGLIEKSEFEPRIKNYKQRLSYLDQQLLQLMNSQNQKIELQHMIGVIEDFSTNVKQKLEGANWDTKRAIITALVKRVEIGKDNLNIIFRIDPYTSNANSNNLLEHCRRSTDPCVPYFHNFRSSKLKKFSILDTSIIQ